jgi:arginase
MIQIIGAPFDFGGKQPGSRLGPAAIRVADLEKTLRDMGFKTKDCGDLSLTSALGIDGFPAFDCLLPCMQDLRTWVEKVLTAGDLPVVLGGEHTLAAASVAAALNQNDERLGLLWIDAHADVHTPGTSGTQNIHGMPIGALRGLESGVKGVKDAQWSQLLQVLGPKRLAASQATWFGLRDVDAPEREQAKKGLPITMHEVDRYGVEETVRKLDLYWRENGVRRIWISFDVDVLDPILAPGTGTAVRGGLSYRESHLLAELLREKLDAPGCPYRLVGIDLVEVNPLTDRENETAKMAVEWIASLLGKTILGVNKAPV